MLPIIIKVTLVGAPKTSQNQTDIVSFKNRQFQRIFEGIEDELAILTATAKYNHATCKTDEKTFNITLAYIDDTKKMLTVLKARMNLIQQTIS